MYLSRIVIKDAFNQLDPKKQGVVPTAKIAEGMQKCGINLRRDQLQQIMNDLEEEGEKTLRAYGKDVEF